MSSCSVVNLAKQLISIPSISPMDLGCQKLISDRLINIGFSVENMNVNQTNNMWAYKGSGTTLAFSGHTDVVPIGNKILWNSPPFSPTVDKGVLFGRGSADMKGALAAMVIAVERFVKKQPDHHGRIAFLITSDEESMAHDGTIKIVSNLIKRKENIDYCIIGEPSSEQKLGDVIKNGRRGSITAYLCIYGVQGHIAYPNFSDNPIHKSISFFCTLISNCWDNGNVFFSPTSVQIYDIESKSSSDNMVPSELTVKFNFRFSNEITSSDIKKKVELLLKHFNLKYSIEWHVSGNPFLTKVGLLSDIVVRSVEELCHISPNLSTSGGTSDGRFIAELGSQIIELGLINKTIHKANECVEIKDLRLLCHLYECIITKIFEK
ncbi:succinyl-diaminopimelate desuccinylase [Buchnera aphidicola str. Bp (Baizongia pistaciae)]|uniref:Succinyl-diaminopimelate desuccinylase n=1 Tax=Buchnera aphidicola subsp. Baizongia pistaciae (strain Bp) TaxID=224915 RepID=DAPE_BUCBP|nr:succinyl-diaminopimelate desuccinylase [Buchnera aphidicola]Q89AY1.1 RecName: Full=Succinyl-diaminopimelate desuccinylase; Short=SDAP desuccinylase; AltName: Full=N-succinyl-LL-2,6-diaminoheptanedioate amidohydrolase [Buchnera aphidicola str. Bp (Baizongia pistaciae)]AAO26824.1 succinyl-diaminopimelate desuccinylase [Buchnera aphidicola str. Bp (Baizongia pistaciae)]